MFTPTSPPDGRFPLLATVPMRRAGSPLVYHACRYSSTYSQPGCHAFDARCDVLIALAFRERLREGLGRLQRFARMTHRAGSFLPVRRVNPAVFLPTLGRLRSVRRCVETCNGHSGRAGEDSSGKDVYP